RNKQVQVTVVVVVSPGSSGRPGSKSHARFLRHIRERPVVIVVIQPVLAEIRHVEIRPTVVVEIADGNAKAPAFVGYTGLIRHVGECSIVIVMKEHGSWSGFLAAHGRYGRPVDQI